MTSTLLPRAQPPRLNPFAFPSDTTFRFVLLIVAVLGTSLFIYHTLFFHLNAAAYHSTFRECWNVREAAFPANTIDPTDLEARNKANDIFQQCLASANWWIAAWMAGGVALVMSIAGMLYWIFPAWMIWRRQLTPLLREDAPDVIACLAELCRDAQLSRQPRFVWNPLDTANNGLAFGYPGHYYIALSGGIVAQFYTDKSTFRAVVLHELAHLRNGDIGKTYFTVAIWRAFVVAALLPFAITLINRGDALGTFMLILRMLALVALVYLTRNAILTRARSVCRRARIGLGWADRPIRLCSGHAPARDRRALAHAAACASRPS